MSRENSPSCKGRGSFLEMNAAAALAQADVGIAIGAGTDMAVESAGIVLVVPLNSRGRAYRRMIQNLIWATGYNALAIPVAAGLFAAQGHHPANEHRGGGDEPVHARRGCQCSVVAWPEASRPGSPERA